MTSESRAAGWCGCAFGMRLTASEEVETLSECSRDAEAHSVAWTRIPDPEGLAEVWSNVEHTRLVDFRFQDGRPMMSVDTDASGAYLVEAPGYGSHVVSADGTRITSALSPDAPWTWQRLFVAQALPLAAAMRGLEPLHASAVGIDGSAVAFSAPSNTGKTSIAMHLVARGAGLVTDDVLAVEVTSSGLRAHPGARLLGAQRHELDAVPVGRDRLGSTLGEDEKVYLRPELEPGPLPLAALYRLARQPADGPLRIVEETPPDPRAILATTFLTYLQAPERLTRHLDFAAQFARAARVFVVHLPANLPAFQAAGVIEQHVRAELLSTTRARP